MRSLPCATNEIWSSINYRFYSRINLIDVPQHGVYDDIASRYSKETNSNTVQETSYIEMR